MDAVLAPLADAGLPASGGAALDLLASDILLWNITRRVELARHVCEPLPTSPPIDARRADEQARERLVIEREHR
jgi:hypothetical protein